MVVDLVGVTVDKVIEGVEDGIVEGVIDGDDEMFVSPSLVGVKVFVPSDGMCVDGTMVGVSDSDAPLLGGDEGTIEGEFDVDSALLGEGDIYEGVFDDWSVGNNDFIRDGDVESRVLGCVLRVMVGFDEEIGDGNADVVLLGFSLGW